MIRLILVILIAYFIYVFYKKTQNPQVGPKIKNLGKAQVVSRHLCPAPKTFVDYIEGKIEGRKKEEIRKHIDSCEDCQDALQAVFDMPIEGLDEEKVPKEVIEKAKRIPKTYPRSNE